MNTADRFDRHVENLMDELAGPGIPGYLDDALATATARPQRRPSILGRLLGGPLASKPPMLRTAMIGLPVVLALSIALVGVLVIGGPNETPSPSPLPSLGTAVPATPGPTSERAQPDPAWPDLRRGRALPRLHGRGEMPCRGTSAGESSPARRCPTIQKVPSRPTRRIFRAAGGRSS